MLRRVVLACLVAVVGYVIVGFIVTMFWLTFVYEAPGGSGNARYGFTWFTVGGWLGAIVGFVVTFRWTGRAGQRSSGEPKEVAGG